MICRTTALVALLSTIVPVQVGADITFTPSVDPVSVPVVLQLNGVSDTLLDYDVFLDFPLPSGITYLGVTDSIQLFAAVVKTDLGIADLAVGDSAGGVSIPPNLGSPTTELFTIEFDVTVGATVPFTNALPGESGVIYKIPNPNFPGPNEDEFIATDKIPITMSSDGGRVILTAIPEPSEWILVLLMTGLLGTVVSKKLFGKKNQAVDA